MIGSRDRREKRITTRSRTVFERDLFGKLSAIPRTMLDASRSREPRSNCPGTLKFGAATVKATSRSSTVRPHLVVTKIFRWGKSQHGRRPRAFPFRFNRNGKALAFRFDA